MYAECQGIVTEVDPILCCFTIQDKRVHLSLLIASTSKIGLPAIGSNVGVKNVIRNDMSFVATKKSELIGEFRNHQLSSTYLSLVKNLNLGIGEIFKIDKIFNLLFKNFPKISNQIKIELIVALIKLLFNKNENCEDKSIISVSNCRHVELKRKYEGFPYWSHGIHPRAKRNTMLLGYLTVHPVYGFLMLRDSNYCLVCIVCNTNARDLTPFVNCYVLIEDYKVVTEIYKDCDNLEYILLKTEDMKVLFRSHCFVKPVLSKGDIVEENKYQNCLEFTLIGKSEVCLSSNKQPTCWLKVRIWKFNDIDQDHMIFLLLPEKFMKVILHLKLYQCYKLHYNQELKDTSNIELVRITSCKIFELVDTSACFQYLGGCNSTDVHSKILSVEECKSYVHTDTKLVSFEGKIHTRRFNEALSSRSQTISSAAGFGMPGSKSTQIVFSWREGGRKFFLDWYLNNWENILMPFGLVPEMKIIVRNVVPQSKKYLKSCIFTSIEVVSYEPSVNFCTVNLYEESYLGWGSKYFFGRGWDIPQGVLISGIVVNIRILGIKIKYSCKGCTENRSNMETDGLCNNCKQEDKEMEFTLTMYVTDVFAESKVIVKDVNFLRFVLRMQSRPFKTWLGALEKIGTYIYSVQGDEQTEEATNLHYDSIRQNLSKYIDNFNKHEIMELHLLCRKLDSDPEKNEGRSLWFYVDARNCV